MGNCTGVTRNGDICPLKETCAKYKNATGDGIKFYAPFQINEGVITCDQYEQTTNEDVSDIGPDADGGDIISD